MSRTKTYYELESILERLVPLGDTNITEMVRYARRIGVLNSLMRIRNSNLPKLTKFEMALLQEKYFQIDFKVRALVKEQFPEIINIIEDLIYSQSRRR